MDTTERRNTRSAKVDSAKKTGVTRWVVLFGLIIIFCTDIRYFLDDSDRKSN